ncbi:MAG: ZIP family metal transporter [bacterium]|nr:ZIP family metal transporter [bacterium]
MTSIKYKHRLNIILGFTAGVIIGLVAFDILPEIFELVEQNHIDIMLPMLAFVVGLLLLHIAEKALLIHGSQEGSYKEHKHPSVGILSALALIAHSFLDGVGIGLGFQISPGVGVVIAIAVIGHDFADGLNTGSLMLASRNNRRKTLIMIFLDAIAPVLGALSTLLFKFSNPWLVLYLGFFAGSLLYISLGDVLPEAHSKDSSYKTIAMTIIGVIFIYFVTQLV